MARFLCWCLAALALLAASGLALGMTNEIPSSPLLTPVLDFERPGMGEQQGTQVLHRGTGRIESLFGMADGPYSQPPELAALEFLRKQIIVTGYAPEELSLVRSIESQGSRFVTYEARVGNLPVYPGQTVVTFDPQMRVVFLFNNLVPVNRLLPTAMSLSKDDAIRVALKYLNVKGAPLGGPFTRAVMWAGDANPVPAWAVTIPALDPQGDWFVMVDANNGAVLHCRNQQKNYNGHGMAFAPDPLSTAGATYGSTGFSDNSDANSTQLQAQRVAVTLRDITYSGGLYRLTGPWVTISELTSPTSAPVTSSDSNGFSFTRDAQGFEDVNVYYNIDTSQRWIQSLGFSNIQHASISVDAHGGTADNSYFTPSLNTINYGEGGVDDAEDADVIWHEYGHAIQSSQVPGWGGGDEDAMGEGFGDYWACSYSYSLVAFNHTWVFNWDGHNPYWDGRLINAGSHYPENNTDIYSGGQIWSQACYDTRNRPNVGRAVMDKIVLQHHFSLGTTSSMTTAAAAILTTDNTLYGGVHYPDIYAGFVPRGLLTSSGAITCTAPNGGQSWNAGTVQTISWSYYNLTGNVKIELNRSYSGGTWELINNTTALTAGSYSWTVTGPATTTARIRVSPVSNSAINDVSNANFSIVASGPSIVVTAPNGGENWLVGDANNITWSSANISENVKIELNRAYPGATWETIIASTANTGSYSWTVTGPVTAAACVRITGVTSTTVGDSSNAVFTVGARGLTVSAPNGGGTLYAGDATSITWSSTNLSENVKIELNRAYPGATWETIVASTANSGSYSWTVTGPGTTAARVRITGVTHTAVGDTSDANFTIAVRSLQVTLPNGGETWFTGEANNITWTSANLSENVKIELNRAYPGATWETIIASTANDGTHPWIVAGTLTAVARIRITGVTHTTVGDTSNGNFTISVHSLSITVPNGGETKYIADSDTIRWTSQNLPENVKIELNRAYPGATWEVLSASAANTGSFVWNVTGAATTTARVRISGTVQTTISDTSNGNFTIAARTVQVTSPNGAENWAVGSTPSITWNSANVPGNVNIDINRSYPAGAWESIAAGTLNTGSYPWIVTGPATASARVRVTSASYPVATDISDANFSVYVINAAPVLVHDPVHDQGLVAFVVTAIVTDDAPGFSTKFYYNPTGGGPADSLMLIATGNPDEYAVSVGPLAEGSYDYYLLTRDAGGLTTQTAVGSFFVGPDCGTEQAYDDGVAERSAWAENTGYKWAVKFDALSIPYVLCNAQIGVSAEHPSAAHSRMRVEVYLADGPAGTPGTLLASRVSGSLGNVIGGVPLSPDNWVPVTLRDGGGAQLTLTGSFYVAVSNLDSAGYEAFLQDTTGALAGRSYVYDPCDSTWYAETVNDSSARRGNRMIRVHGYGLVPPTSVVLSLSGADMRLDWADVGAPYYHIYSAATVGGPYSTFEGSSTTTTFIDLGAASGGPRYYQVRASTLP